MYKITKGFTSSNGKEYPNIKNIHFDNIEELRKNIGKFVLKSKDNTSSDFDISYDGVEIYLDENNTSLARRIYSDYPAYKCISYSDEVLVDSLKKKQNNIKLTKFPTGIVTIENKVIGQEIPFYSNSETIKKHFISGNLTKKPTQIYLEILNILKELYNNNIIYKDTHTQNFLIDKTNNIINLIDFDRFLITIDNDNKYDYKYMIENIKSYLIRELNDIIGLNFDDYKKANTLEEIEESVLEYDYKIRN